jgi:hypothetical protein
MSRKEEKNRRTEIQRDIGNRRIGLNSQFSIRRSYPYLGAHACLGTYVVAESGGSGTLNVNRSNASPWEEINLRVGGKNHPPFRSLYGALQIGTALLLRYGSSRYHHRYYSVCRLENRLLPVSEYVKCSQTDISLSMYFDITRIPRQFLFLLV